MLFTRSLYHILLCRYPRWYKVVSSIVIRNMIEYYTLRENTITEIGAVETGCVTVKADLLIKNQEFEFLVKEELPDNLIVEDGKTEDHGKWFIQRV